MKFTSIFFPASESIFDLSKIQKKHVCHSERNEDVLLRACPKNLENINYMHTRSFVAMLLWMTDGYIKKAVVRKSENSRRPNGVLFKSILCLDFFPVSLSEKTYSS